MPARDLVVYRDGLYAFTNSKGMRVMVLRLKADPVHTDEWIANEALKYYRKDWRREMEGDWTTPAGEPYFPIFTEIGREKYVHMATKLIKGPVFRSFDFGRRRPACTWFQYDQKADRIWLLREFMPHDLQTHEFRDAVRFLSNELDSSELPERSRRWIDAYAARPNGNHCPPPWFPLGTRFIDIGGKELLQSGASAVDPELATARAIFAEVGMHLSWVNPRVLARNRLVDKMLMMRPDGWPGTFIDPQCEQMIEGFDGGFAYATGAAGQEDLTKEAPRDDGYMINLLDAYGYGVAAVVPPDRPHEKQPPTLVGYRDGREPIYANLEDEVGWKETRNVR